MTSSSIRWPLHINFFLIRSNDSKQQARRDKKHSYRLKCGYNQHRAEFEAKWKESAEDSISEWTFDKNETKDEHELKLEALRLYNQSVKTREKRKEYILNYGVMHGLKDYNKNSEYKEIFDNLAMFEMYAERMMVAGLLVD